jgi:N-methylhydantoinase A
MSDVKHDYIRSKLSPLAKVNETNVAKVFDELQAHAMRDLKAENFRDDQIGIERALDMRYAGQGYEITIACDDGLDLAALRRKFDDSHKQMFGHTAPNEPVEIVSYRLRGVGRVPPVKLPSYRPQGLSLKDALRETRKARFNGNTLDCPVYQRDRLDVGVRFDGPAIIDQLDATTVIPPGHSVRVDEFKNILITARSA